MPAEKPADGVSPVQGQQNYTQRFPFAPKNWFSDRLLLLVVAIFLLILLLVPGLLSEARSSLQKILKPRNTSQLESSVPDKVIQSAEKVAEETKSYQAIKVLFDNQRLRYYENGEFAYRIEAEKTKEKAATLFTEEFKDYGFIVPCLDDKCEILPYSSKVKEIANDVENIEQGIIPDDLRRATIASLRVFSYYKDTPRDVLYDSYYQIFNNLDSIYQISNSEKIKVDMNRILQMMKDTNPERFSVQEKSDKIIKL